MPVTDQINVMVGAAPSGGLTLYQSVALGITFVLALANFILTFYLTKIGRRRSVDDEFWFRKVVAPAVIDKTLVFSSKWSSELTKAAELKGNVKKTKQSLADCKNEAEEIVLGCLCLKLFSGNHYQSATNAVDAMVDEVTECFFALSSPAISASDVTKVIDSKRRAINDQMLALFKGLKGLQAQF